MIEVAGVPTSTKLPGTYVRTVFGGPGTSAGDGQLRMLCIGNMIATDITAASPSVSVTAGTWQSGGTPTAAASLVRSESDAAALFGAGSELHLMCWRALEQYPGCPLWAVPVVEPTAGARAAARIYVSGTATAPLTARLWIAGQRVDCQIATGDTAAVIVASIAAALNAVSKLPTTAQYGSGPASPVTVTAKQFGVRGNLITIRGELLDGTTVRDIPANAGTSTPPAALATAAGVSLAFYNITAAGLSTKYLSGGSGTDDAEHAAALTAVSKTQYHRIACASTTNASANDALDRVSAWLSSQSGPTKGIRMQAVAAQVTSLAAAIASGTPAARTNNPLMQLVLAPKAQHTPGEIAAQVCAARLAGDVELGGDTIGEASKPSANLDGCQLVSITESAYEADRFDADDPDTALQYGLTPLIASPRAGYLAIARSVTSRWYDATSAPNYGVLDTSDVTVTQFVTDDLAREHARTFKGYNLAPDGDTPPKSARTTTPSLVRAWIHARLKTHEDNGIVVEVDARASLLKVEPQSGSAWRLNAEIPIVPIPGYHVFAANARQLSATLT